MIGELPTSVTFSDGYVAELNTDYRVALTIFEALADPDLNDSEKTLTLLYCLYEDAESIPRADLEEACEQASAFLDGSEQHEEKKSDKPVMDWKQDEQLIFSAVNRIAGKEVRAIEYMHWWTFLGLMSEIDEKSLFSTVVGLRQKKNSGKKLEKWEQDFYKKHKKMVDIQKRLSKEEQARRDAINRLLNGK